MFLEDIKDKIMERKLDLGTFLLVILGKTLGFIIEGDPLGDFTGWWLFALGIIALAWVLVDAVKKSKNQTSKERLSYFLQTVILAVLLYMMYRTLT